ncbi:MAG: P1 family peptidase [Chloroflexi bacterium]|nr:P1 family peptidase [Chloroflexota bacterium]
MTLKRPRARDLGIKIGRIKTGRYNAITDVAGVRVGHTTLIEGAGKLIPGTGPVRTGVTAILPHGSDLFLEKVTGAVLAINGFGEVTNAEQIHEMGCIEGPIMLTNSLNVARVADAVIDWSLDRNKAMGTETWGISPCVAETNDMYLNDIRGRHVQRDHVFLAIDSAKGGPVEEGAVGGGTGMICYDFKGGIGTASRKLPDKLGGYTVGILAQTNFGWRPQLMIDGVPIGRELEQYKPVRRKGVIASPSSSLRINSATKQSPTRNVEIASSQKPLLAMTKGSRVTDSGSVIVVLATDAPCSTRILTRLARRAQNGLARTGSHTGNTSGDFVIAFSTPRRKKHFADALTYPAEQIIEQGDLINYMFWAVVEATEEAILNSLFKADTMIGRDDRIVPGLPIEETVALMNQYGRKQVHLP